MVSKFDWLDYESRCSIFFIFMVFLDFKNRISGQFSIYLIQLDGLVFKIMIQQSLPRVIAFLWASRSLYKLRTSPVNSLLPMSFIYPSLRIIHGPLKGNLCATPTCSSIRTCTYMFMRTLHCMFFNFAPRENTNLLGLFTKILGRLLIIFFV